MCTRLKKVLTGNLKDNLGERYTRGIASICKPSAVNEC